MIWSVSTLLWRSGTPMPVWVVNFSMADPSLAVGTGAGGLYAAPARRPADAGSDSRSDGELSVPRTAVAAATTGETRCVRPPLPCRPSKFRLDVDAQRSPT